jgi:hypothetical protein
MNTMRAAAASVVGARHTRIARNGQDAAIAHLSGDAAVVVVCDGCSAGIASEVGARLGANLFARAIAARLERGASPSDRAMWEAARREVVDVIASLVARMPGDALHDHFLFTIVAAAARGDDVAVWALGDGYYRAGGVTRELGPFDGNAPPYLAYDLIGEPRDAVFERVQRPLIVATDGASELDLAAFEPAKFLDHPDALRRELTILARPHERIDWDARRVDRVTARIQDDCAVGIIA